MKNFSVMVVCSLTLSLMGFTAMAATPKQAIEHFNRDTGELYWDLDSEVRLKYISNCQVDSDGFDSFHDFMLNLDYFSILDYEGKTYVNCKERGLRVTYKLREDEMFPAAYAKSIVINNETLRYYSETFDIIKSLADPDNYQRIYAALQTHKPIVAAVYSGFFIRDAEKHFGKQETPEVELIINASNLNESDEVNKNLALIESNRRNSELHHKYWIVILLNVALFSCLALGLLFILRNSRAPCGKISAGKAKLKKIALSALNKIKKNKSTIIKTDNLKPYSVADELLKWTHLKEAGIVSEEEFQEARKKIMGK